jgi:hypothetical protein
VKEEESKEESNEGEQRGLRAAAYDGRRYRYADTSHLPQLERSGNASMMTPPISPNSCMAATAAATAAAASSTPPISPSSSAAAMMAATHQ